ncbi:hypothetical protein K450DRAFT_221096 [Umbelopsis ramanniana AG]|uniref:Ras-GEF domain-containing protein n=1 Tax=Umbelopsis ramanniana AG TaxID=1314678 RepID=A0AAD5EJ40_UMBRA|nr:uncharacterized protein K450DRAFT_221096 [Umbelopsis ramanniana AG]KAI8584015.1 hypothetical protein K450DRAFT_221096 [Umbelopsis ramanniana AG]
MEDIQTLLNNAKQLTEDGNIKEGYLSNVALMEMVLKQMHDVKFVHHSIVSKPAQYNTMLSVMRACLTNAEEIVNKHSHSAASSTPPASRRSSVLGSTTTGSTKPRASPSIDVSVRSPTPTFEEDELVVSSTSTDRLGKPAPPLPPKPSRMQNKPVVPPKPARSGQSSKPTSPVVTPNHTGSTISGHSSQPDYVPPTIVTEGAKLEITRPKIPIATPQIPPRARPQTMPDPSSLKPLHIARPMSVSSETLNDATLLRVVGEGEIDPTNLAPAQTNSGDSLTPSSRQATDHVPNIPVPPLLTAYRHIQARHDKLDTELKLLKEKKRHLLSGSHPDDVTESDLNSAIMTYTSLTADAKLTLNKVRTIYMSAATIPSVLQFQPYLVAYQITLIEAAIFIEIPVECLLIHSARTPQPRIVASTDFFNYTTRLIEHSILLPQEASHRAQHINHWIKVAAKCQDLNNYQSLKAIVSALGTPPVQRLKRTWACIPKKSMLKLEAMNELMSEADNYGRYRECMGMVNVGMINGRSVAQIKAEHAARPTVPFLGTFIQDITYLLAAAKSQNLAKPTDDPRIQEVLSTMEKFQRGPRYPPVPNTAYIKSSTSRSSFRPTSLTSALHRSTSSKKDRLSTSSLFSSVDDDDEEIRDMEEQQQLITQYLLMRPWVNEETVDELSSLREPPSHRGISSPSSRSSGGAGSGNYTSSIMSNTSSTFVRMSAGNGSGTDSRPTSMDEYPDGGGRSSLASEDAESLKRGFWPFSRRSHDGHRPTSLINSDRASIHSLRRSTSEINVGHDEEDEDDEQFGWTNHSSPEPKQNDHFKQSLAHRLAGEIERRQH